MKVLLDAIVIDNPELPGVDELGLPTAVTDGTPSATSLAAAQERLDVIEAGRVLVVGRGSAVARAGPAGRLRQL